MRVELAPAYAVSRSAKRVAPVVTSALVCKPAER
jgi:hypothetical protein